MLSASQGQGMQFGQLKRRQFLTLVGGAAAAWPTVARAQQPERVRRIGILMPFPPTNAEMQVSVRAFREELRKRGWMGGLNVQFDERWTSDNMDLIRSAATNLVELAPDAIMAVGARVIPILMELTRSIPIVVPSGADPVAYGYAESLARPGRNVTGFAPLELSVVGKMLQTLKEIAPTVSHISMIYNPDNRAGPFFVRSFESAAGSLGFKPTFAHIHGLADIESAIAAAAAQPDGGIFVPLDVSVLAFAEQTVTLVARHRLPAVYSERAFVKSGGLLYYGADRIELFRSVATYIDRILRGEKAGDLPFQLPTKYDLVINLRAAKALGLTIPPHLFFTADEVIE
jgi:putative tryptophan/tyrosine transport system substrate-binding protein